MNLFQRLFGPSAKPAQTRNRNNGLGTFKKARSRLIHNSYFGTYDVGRNAAKRERRAARGVRK